MYLLVYPSHFSNSANKYDFWKAEIILLECNKWKIDVGGNETMGLVWVLGSSQVIDIQQPFLSGKADPAACKVSNQLY